ncbi:caprin-2 [Mytilus galloprovincialis]|uniref:Caprin-2 n=1 Tax=Mytilus galloprovincialis TaxID=29158 RepID=A0A8B6CF76_MYTGA|nr:caprin-2 [Mytilus galloprovincialis]
MAALFISLVLFLLYANVLTVRIQPSIQSLVSTKHEFDTIKDEIAFLREKLVTETVKPQEQISSLRLEMDAMKNTLNAEIMSLRMELASKGSCSCQENINSSDVHSNRAERLLAPSESTSQPSTTVHVAFSAVLTHIISLGELQEIKYDKVLLNIGSGYDVRHGHFTSPVNGVYLLSSSTFKHHLADDLYVEMVKNGVQLVANEASTAEYNAGSHTVIIQMNKGDMVWVRHYWTKTSIEVYGTPTTPFTSFAGVLLFEI